MLCCDLDVLRSYAALETLNEPHQILNVMPCLSVVARALLTGGKGPEAGSNLLRYPEGPTHLFPVLRCLLPGIDPNDFNKTVVSNSSSACGFDIGLCTCTFSALVMTTLTWKFLVRDLESFFL